MGGGWVRLVCRCGRSVELPTRMAAQRWPDLRLGDLVGRLRCEACGARPAEVSYADRADDWRTRGGLRRVRRIWLVR